MPQITYSTEFNEDVQRITEFMLRISPETVGKMTLQIFDSLDILLEQPEIGSPYRFLTDEYDNVRKLVIPFGKSAYSVLYNFDYASDTIVLLRIKHSRERDFSSPRKM